MRKIHAENRHAPRRATRLRRNLLADYGGNGSALMTHLRDRVFGNMHFDYNAVAGGIHGNCNPAGVQTCWAGILFAGARAANKLHRESASRSAFFGVLVARAIGRCAGHANRPGAGQRCKQSSKQFRLTRHRTKFRTGNLFHGRDQHRQPLPVASWSPCLKFLTHCPDPSRRPDPTRQPPLRSIPCRKENPAGVI